MYRLVTSLGTNAYLDGGAQVINLTTEIREQLERWFPNALGYFDRAGGFELQGFHKDCRGRHDNPLLAAPEHQPRPSLPRVETASSTVVGCEVLALINLGAALGPTWIRAAVTATPNEVALSDGRILPADTRACTFASEPPASGGVTLAADGTPWRREKKGPLTRLAKFGGDVTTLGELATNGARRVLMESPGGKWQAVELA